MLTAPIRGVDGWVPIGPGLGVNVNEEAVRRHPYGGGRPFSSERR